MRLLGYFVLWCCLVMIWFHLESGKQIFSYTPETVISKDSPLQKTGQSHAVCFPVNESIPQKVRSRKLVLWRKQGAICNIFNQETNLLETLSQCSFHVSGKPTLFLLHHAFLLYEPVVY